MKCNQCEMLQITTGGMSLPCHEIGCPNTHKVWNEEDQEWVNPPQEEDDEEFPAYDGPDEEEEVDEDDGDWYGEDEDLGGTGHGDISYSDADPGL